MNAVRAALAANLPLIHDPRVGIIAHLQEIPREPGAPDFAHFAATTCDPSAFGCAAGPFVATAAGPTREEAAARALQRALARYAAALYERGALPLASHAEADFPRVNPREFALHSTAQYARPGFPYVPFDKETPVRWTGAINLADGEVIHLPAAFVWHPYPYLRLAGDLPIVQPVVSGLACEQGVAAASLAGLCEIVARDGVAIFWQSLTAPPRLRLETLPAELAAVATRFEAAGDRVVILDVTTNNRLNAFSVGVISDQPDRPAFSFAASAALDPAAAIREALCNVAEVRRLAAEAKRRRPAPSAANEWEDVVAPEDHLAFAADHDNRAAIDFFIASEERRDFADYDNGGTGAAETDLEACVTRILTTGSNVYAANLTSEDIGALGINICRVIVPGYQPLFAGHHVRALGGERLYEVPQRLGYRGVPRSSGGNPAPHPFL